MARKTINIKIRSKPRRAGSKRKIVRHTPAKPKMPTAEMQSEKPASRPRKRNALGAGRMARIKPKDVSKYSGSPEYRPVTITKATHQKPSEDFYAPWVLAYRDHPSPEETGRNYVRLQQALLVTTLLLGVFDASGLVSWVRGLPAGPVEDRIILSAETWNDWMENWGLNDYMTGMKKFVKSLKETEWRDF